MMFAAGKNAQERNKIGRAQSELQSPDHLVCRLLLEKKKTPPLDPAGSGPLMIDECSLLLSGRSRGIFLSKSISIVSGPTLRSNAAIWAPYSEIVVAAASSTF